MSVPRRLAAILAADVVGFSRLMEIDEAGTLAALQAHRAEFIDPLIAWNNGRIVKLMGDGALVEFASVVDAVACAVAIQQGMAERSAGVAEDKRIAFRIGVNLGDVIVEGNDIYGDGVNVAARLEALASPGGVCISGTVRDHIAGKLEYKFTDGGAQSVKNLSRPVHVWRWSAGDSGPDPASGESAGLPLPNKPSIAVLPFANMSGDPEQEHFSDGITEDIITELARFNGLMVIARHSSFAYRGRSIDAREIGRALGVQYLLEGSIRVVGARARITAQLIDTNTGSHLWAERYERDIRDIFSIQDEISAAIASMAVLRLQDDRLERIASKPPNSVTAYDLCLRGKRAFALATEEGMSEAQRLFEAALEIDPNYAHGIAGLAFVHNMATSYRGWGVSLDEPHELALKLARRAAALDPTDHLAELILGWCHMFRRQYSEAKRHFDRSHALNPNDADGLMFRALYLAYTAQCDEATRTVAQAFRLNPKFPDRYLESATFPSVLCRQYERAIEFGSQISGSKAPEFPGWLAVAHAHLGNLDEARSLGAAFRRNVRRIWHGDPDVDDKELVRWFLLDNPIQHQDDIDQFLAGLRIAGLKL